LAQAFADVTDAELTAKFQQSRKRASEAMIQYAAFLQSERLPQATDDFAIGADAFAKMLSEAELLSQSPDQVLEIGLRELKREQQAFADAARRIDPGKPALDVYKSLQRDHPSEQTLIPDIAKHLESIRKFVVDRKIVTIPSEARVKVEETPKFDRATGFASMDSPGPFEQKATQAFYYVTPTE